jgi:PPOX class probable F420-dependent enzyme
MAVEDSQRETVKEFLKDTSRGVLMTRRKDGGIQSSPMALAADDDGNVLFSTRSTAAKVRNLKRDPYAAVCVITEKFLGPWLHVEGHAEVEYLPAALPALRDFYRRRRYSDDTESDAFKHKMETEGRCLIRVRVSRVVIPPALRAAIASTGA